MGKGLAKKLDPRRWYRCVSRKITRRQRVVISGFFFTFLTGTIILSVTLFAAYPKWQDYHNHHMSERFFLADVLWNNVR